MTAAAVEETGVENKLLDFLLGELGIRGDQATLHGFTAHRIRVDPLAVVGQGDHHLAAFPAQFQIDAARVGLPGALAAFPGFDTVVHRVTQHVLQGRDHALHQGAVQFPFRVENIEIHPLAHFAGDLPDDATQTGAPGG